MFFLCHLFSVIFQDKTKYNVKPGISRFKNILTFGVFQYTDNSFKYHCFNNPRQNS